jgi:hypothetical protein
MDDVQEDIKGAMKEIPHFENFREETRTKVGNLSENFHGLRKYVQDSFVAIQNKL